MVDYIGVIITFLGAVTLAIKDPWEHRLIGLFTLGHLGIAFLVIGVPVSVYTTYTNNIEKLEYKIQLNTINEHTERTLKVTEKGIDTLLTGYNQRTNELLTNFSENYNALMATIIRGSDSTLKSQLDKVKSEYNIVNEKFKNEKETADRYYYSQHWPYSGSDKKIPEVMSDFVPGMVREQLNGTDNFIIWRLIENNGYLSREKYNMLHEDIWEVVKPFELAVHHSMLKLQKFGVVNFDYKNFKVEFTDEYFERLTVYQKHFGTDSYFIEMNNLTLKYFDISDYNRKITR